MYYGLPAYHFHLHCLKNSHHEASVVAKCDIGIDKSRLAKKITILWDGTFSKTFNTK